MKTLILDNYDSFTYNLYQYVAELGGNPVVHRNDAIDLDGVRALAPTHIILSPGPGNPDTAGDIGIGEALITYAAEEDIPLLGVCLGHQLLARHYGATVSRAPAPYHGKASMVRVERASPLFAGVDGEIEAMRYHSLHAEEDTFPPALTVTGRTSDGVVMAIEHERLPQFGVQFHPESIGTPAGKRILRNFLSLRGPCAAGDRSASGLFARLFSGTLSAREAQEAFEALVALPLSAGTLLQGARALRERMVRVPLPPDAIDTCGTGGSGKRTINTSTLVAFLVAACGEKVAKHGNRSASGNCGCFDLLGELGVGVMLTPDAERRLFEELGLVFLFAPLHHPALRFVAPLRKSHGKKTLFNLLGPLCHPAGGARHLLGTGNADDAVLLCETLRLLGDERSIVVSGLDGLDEVSVCAPSIIRDVSTGTASYFLPSDVGLHASSPDEITGGSPAENARIFLELAQGKGTEAHRNLVLVNAAHALLLADRSRSLADAFALAKETLRSGAVHDLFSRYRALSLRFS